MGSIPLLGDIHLENLTNVYQHGQEVKVLDYWSKGQFSAWVQIPLLVSSYKWWRIDICWVSFKCSYTAAGWNTPREHVKVWKHRWCGGSDSDFESLVHAAVAEARGVPHSPLRFRKVCSKGYLPWKSLAEVLMDDIWVTLTQCNWVISLNGMSTSNSVQLSRGDYNDLCWT